MKESQLIDYLKGDLSAKELGFFINKSITRGTDTIKNKIIRDLKSGFTLQSSNILKIINDYQEGSFNNLEIVFIGDLIEFSDEIEALDSREGMIILKIITDWANHEINYPITKENMRKWKTYLETGNYTLS